uniref:Pre-rRNA-processing protein TSR1 homolog n=1 Tax=Corethrella appendiculata TaxID=1370023 RepID=U5EVS0_9DIPT
MAIGTIHNAGALKQTNKSHKHGGHRSKREIDRTNKGKVSVKTISKKNNRLLKREDRRLQAKQIRKNKREEIIAKKRQIGGEATAPFLTCLLPLHENIDVNSALTLIEGCDEEAIIGRTSKNISHVHVPRFRQRFSFVTPKRGHGEELNTLDCLKVCDSTVLLLSAAASEDDVIDKIGSKIINMALTQGLPTPIVCLMDLESIPPKKRAQIKATIQKDIATILPEEKLMSLDSGTDALNLLRRIGGQKRKTLHFRENRPHLLAEQVDFVPNQDGLTGTLQVTGYLRGIPLSVDQLVHIPGLGDFQMSQIDAPADPHKIRKSENEASSSMEDNYKILAKADATKQTSLQRENIPDEMDAEQTWPTEEEIAASKEENKHKKLIKRIPKGMNEYMASWIPDIEEVSENDESEDEDEDDDNDDEDFMSCDSDSEKKNQDEEEEEEEFDEISVSEAPISSDKYDKEMDMEEEKQTLEQLKAAKTDELFPDEIDTPADVPARTRFQKYRGLESFKTSPWDVKENLPFDYAKIYQFQNFDRTKRRVLKESKDVDDGILTGWYVKIHVANVPRDLWNSYQTVNIDGQNSLILFGLLPHEHKMSVMNVVLKRTADSTIPIKSKERLIVQCGYRRFIVNPIYSQHTNADKHKYERYFRPGAAIVATFFAPIQFPPSPVLCFRENPNTSLSLVASGNILSCNPDRVILKRAVLSGHPFKIHRKSATIRFMFFNKDDIDYFKPCKLRTKCGRLGHIKESLGTHGHMKCVFDGQLKSFDTVLLYLYKRVFPKWTYEDCTVSCSSEAPTNSLTEGEDAKMQE